jgi:hypothetical protein
MPGIIYNPFAEPETLTVPDVETFYDVVETMTDWHKSTITQVEVISRVPLPVLPGPANGTLAPTTMLLQRECVRLEKALRDLFDETLDSEGSFLPTTFDGYEISSSSTIHGGIVTIRLLIDVSVYPYVDENDDEEDEDMEYSVGGTVNIETLAPVPGDYIEVDVGGHVEWLRVVSRGVEVEYRGEILLAEPTAEADLYGLCFPRDFANADAYVDWLKLNPDVNYYE